MVKSSRGRTNVRYVLEFFDEPVTSFGGIVLAERVASRLGLWSSLESRMPKRTRCQYDWLTIIKTAEKDIFTPSYHHRRPKMQKTHFLHSDELEITHS